jgi:hypothetical protein
LVGLSLTGNFQLIKQVRLESHRVANVVHIDKGGKTSLYAEADIGGSGAVWRHGPHVFLPYVDEYGLATPYSIEV